jgi:hypothetical protein
VSWARCSDHGMLMKVVGPARRYNCFILKVYNGNTTNQCSKPLNRINKAAAAC